MAISTRLIRRRIKTVANTKKITKAMELVAAAKMRRAVSTMLMGRPYARAALAAISRLSTVVGGSGTHPLLRSHGSGKTLVILFSSDRGLCGGFNSKLFAAATAFMRGKTSDDVAFAVVGKKGQEFLRKKGWYAVAAWDAPSQHPTFLEIRSVADLAINDFVNGTYASVVLLTTDYQSALVQTVRVQEVLPVIPRTLAATFALNEEAGMLAHDDHDPDAVLFEPDPSTVLSAILPRLIEAQLYHALLESLASEHSARMMAMRSATDSAGEMIESLTLTFNQARQAGITREIAEISAGAAAIS